MEEMKPMMKQYYDIKEQNEDCILFFRLGDFYEMFGDDAKVASKELDLALTSRDKKKSPEDRIPMCGVPYHSSESYIARLISKGYKVAICEQMEDPATAKGLVKRDIVRIVSPGTVIESSMLEDKKNNYLCSIVLDETGAAVCFSDISTGEMYATWIGGMVPVKSITNEIGRFSPREAILCDAAAENKELVYELENRLSCRCEKAGDWRFVYSECVMMIKKQFKTENLADLGIVDEKAVVCAVGGLLSFLYDTQKTDLSHISKLNVYGEEKFMALDLTARYNLELCETMRGREKKGTLLWVLDKTGTAMGGRLIRSWIEKPLLNPVSINRRLNAVEELKAKDVARKELALALRNISDIERLIARLVYGTANCKDMISLSNAITYIPRVKECLRSASSAKLKEVLDGIKELYDLKQLIDAAICDDPPLTVREGKMVRKGFDPEVDRLRDILGGGRSAVLEIEARERERTGIKKLKVGYNRVFGYYIEISKALGDVKVPEDYMRKQTLTSSERYITHELKTMESEIITAEERLKVLEYKIFNDIRLKIAERVDDIQKTAKSIAEADVLCSFATVAVENNYTKPQIDTSDVIEIREGRHPVVEKVLRNSIFVPNDTFMNNRDELVEIITGPNMAGKSTYMRQVALITLMAHIGSFVPAKSARIGIVDRIFTRVGASDDLASGQSTFMVEMSEVADILKNATPRSLLILDEIGRGTSTFDGMAIARAVLEFTATKSKLGAKTLFATHYHELTDLEQTIPGAKNYNIVVKKKGDNIIFLRKIVRGGADDSYGIEVAKLAGLPNQVIERAKQVLASLESGEIKLGVPPHTERAEKNTDQLTFADTSVNEVIEEIKTLDLNTLTPIEAMNVLFKAKQKLG